MKKIIKFARFHIFLVGLSTGMGALAVLLLILVLTGQIPWIKAAGVGTGAPDVNAQYWNGADWDDDITLTGETTLSATTTLTNVDWANSENPLPSGLIALFDTDCPSGWTRVSALDNKFLVASSSYNTAVGGADSITLAIANLPSHTHTGTTASDGAHTHTLGHGSAGSTAGAGVNAGNWGTINTGSNGAHTHTFTTAATGSGTAFDNRPAYATIVICKKD